MEIRSLTAFVIISYACIHCSTHDKDQISPKEELVDLKGRPALVVSLKMVNLFCKPDEYVLLKRRFNLSGLPRTILVSRDFKVIQNHGKRASDITDAEIIALLSKGH